MASWLCHDGQIIYPLPGEVLVKLDLEEALEHDSGGVFAIRRSDRVLLRPLTLTHSEHDGPDRERTVHQAIVMMVGRGYVILRIKAEVITRLQRDSDTADTCDVRFAMERSDLVAMHRAIDAVDLSLVFPDPVARPSAWQHQEPSLDRLLGDTRLDDIQIAMVAQIVGAGGAGVQSSPLLISGAFGTGKSRVIEEAVLQIVHLHPNARVLLCTAHDSTADCYLLRLAAMLEPEHARKLMRVSGHSRLESDIAESVLRYCAKSVSSLGSHQRSISRPDVEASSIIVTTMLGADELAFARSNVGPESFTHIICDEAAQVPEPLVLIPLSLAARRTRVVMAGDHKLPGSWDVTPVADRLGLTVSVVQRMVALPFYQTAGGGSGGCGSHSNLKVLVRNYRNHPVIVSLTAKLFYGGDPRVFLPRGAGPDWSAVKHMTPSHWHSVQGVSFPLIIVGVQGKELKDADSPSIYNNFEALEVADRAYRLVTFHGVAEKDMVVLTAYDKQVSHIMAALSKRSLTRVRVTSTAGILALEPRVLLLSTVRMGPGTSGVSAGSGVGRRFGSSDQDSVNSSSVSMGSGQGWSRDAGAVEGEERCRTVLTCALTRVRGLLVVVSDPSLVFADPYLSAILDACAQNGTCDGALIGGGRAVPLRTGAFLTAFPAVTQGPYGAQVQTARAENRVHVDPQADAMEEEKKETCQELQQDSKDDETDETATFDGQEGPEATPPLKRLAASSPMCGRMGVLYSTLSSDECSTCRAPYATVCMRIFSYFPSCPHFWDGRQSLTAASVQVLWPSIGSPAASPQMRPHTPGSSETSAAGGGDKVIADTVDVTAGSDSARDGGTEDADVTGLRHDDAGAREAGRQLEGVAEVEEGEGSPCDRSVKSEDVAGAICLCWSAFHM